MLNIPDLINGLFESLGGFFVLLSIVKTLKDKSAEGVHWLTILFFTSWGYWNIFYYHHLNQTLSWFGGFFVVSMNTVWTVLLIYYSRRNKRDGR